jgi:hypothetical protein
METQIDPVNYVRDWAIDRIVDLKDQEKIENAKSIMAEFDEWINLPEDEDEISYLCLEDEEWTEEQEIDTK